MFVFHRVFSKGWNVFVRIQIDHTIKVIVLHVIIDFKRFSCMQFDLKVNRLAVKTVEYSGFDGRSTMGVDPSFCSVSTSSCR